MSRQNWNWGCQNLVFLQLNIAIYFWNNNLEQYRDNPSQIKNSNQSKERNVKKMGKIKKEEKYRKKIRWYWY